MSANEEVVYEEKSDATVRHMVSHVHDSASKVVPSLGDISPQQMRGCLKIGIGLNLIKDTCSMGNEKTVLDDFVDKLIATSPSVRQKDGTRADKALESLRPLPNDRSTNVSIGQRLTS